MAEAVAMAGNAPPARWRTLRIGLFLLVLPAALFAALGLAVPLVGLVVSSLTHSGKFSLANYVELVTDSFYWEVTYRTIKISVLTTAVALLVSYPAALCLYFAEARYKNLLLFIIVSPLFVSGVVRTYGWIVLLSRDGALNALLPGPLEVSLMRTETAIILGLLHIFVPFMVLSINAAMVKIDRRQLSAAASLGASQWRQLRDVILPLSRPGVVSGCVLVFALSMTAFATPVLLGGAVNKTLAFLIYQYNLQLGDPYMGSAIAILLLGVTILLVRVTTALFDRRAAWETPR